MDPEAPAQRACKMRLLCDTQLYMRRQLNGSVLRPWSDSSGRLAPAGSMGNDVIKTVRCITSFCRPGAVSR